MQSTADSFYSVNIDELFFSWNVFYVLKIIDENSRRENKSLDPIGNEIEWLQYWMNSLSSIGRTFIAMIVNTNFDEFFNQFFQSFRLIKSIESIDLNLIVTTSLKFSTLNSFSNDGLFSIKFPFDKIFNVIVSPELNKMKFQTFYHQQPLKAL